MVREHAYDASELALVTYFQAKEHDKGLVLLPAAMLARFQHGTMLYNSERGTLTPSDLPGRRIGVRSYSQTTGVWIRGILENDYEIDLSGVQWVTFEDGHVAEADDPPGVIRARHDQRHNGHADCRRIRCGNLWRRAAEGSTTAKRDHGSRSGGAILVRQARPRSGQPHGRGH